MSKPELILMGEYAAADMAALEVDYIVHRYWAAADKGAFLSRHAGTVRALATRGDLGVSAEVINALPKLELICCFGVGVDAIDLVAAKARGIRVTTTPNVLNEDVADLALALMLGIARQIPQADAFTRSGAWAQGNFPLLTRMNGKRLGILGLGRIGMAIALRAESFSMPVAYCTRAKRSDVAYRYYSTAIELAAHSDFLLAILPGGDATARIVNADVLRALGSNGYFINVARGSVVDEPALLEALEAKTIAGAALDVFWNEPKIDPRFFSLQNVVLHPHGGSGTRETRAAMGQLVRDNLAAYFAGQPLLSPII